MGASLPSPAAPIGWIAVAWVTVISVLFVLPTQYPVNRNSFNYAPVAVGVVLLGAAAWWLATARRTFRGPVSHGTPQELAALEAERL